MKRRITGVFAVALLLCAGCAETVAEPTPTPTPTPTQSVEPAPTPPATPGPVIEKTVDRWLRPGWADKSSYGGLGEIAYLYQTDDMSVVINYPCIAGEGENSEINRLLADEALGDWGTDEAKQWEDGVPMGGTVDGDWHASRCDEKLLSVRFRTEWYIMGAAHPAWKEQAVTIDRATGKKLSLDDLVDTGDDFETWLNAQNWTQLNGRDVDDGSNSADRLSRYLFNGGAAAHTEDFYLTDEELVIITWNYSHQYNTHFSVPLSDLTLKGDDLWNG